MYGVVDGLQLWDTFQNALLERRGDRVTSKIRVAESRRKCFRTNGTYGSHGIFIHQRISANGHLNCSTCE